MYYLGQYGLYHLVHFLIKAPTASAITRKYLENRTTRSSNKHDNLQMTIYKLHNEIGRHHNEIGPHHNQIGLHHIKQSSIHIVTFMPIAMQHFIGKDMESNCKHE